jgi:hypothetical protein
MGLTLLLAIAPAWAQPVVTAVSPMAARPGETVFLTGQGLSGVKKLILGRQGTTDFRVMDDTRLVFRVPDPGRHDSVWSPIYLVGEGGLGRTPGEFQIMPPVRAETKEIKETKGESSTARPVVASLEPNPARPGGWVLVTGRGFAKVTSVGVHPRRKGEGFHSAPFHVVDDSTLVFQVPQAFPSRPWTATLELKGADESCFEGFWVGREAKGGAPPELEGFGPLEGRMRERVVLSGHGLERVTGVALGDLEIPRFVAWENRIVCWLPDTERDLPLEARWRLTVGGKADGGDALLESPTAFRFRALPPILQGMRPRRGPAGTVLVLTGLGLGTASRPAEAVRVGGVTIRTFLKNTPHEIWVQVPLGAVTGPVTVQAGETSRPFESPFEVTARTSPALRTAAAYLTQAVQARDGSVPLVAGRDAMLRVFVLADQGNTAAPAVWATLRNARGETLQRSLLAAPIPGVPTEVDEDNLESSWNLRVPGRWVQPGMSLHTELSSSDGKEPIESERSWPVDVRTVPTLGLTLIPVRWNGAVGNVREDGRQPEDWLRLLRRIYPVRDVDLKVGEEFDASALPPEPDGRPPYEAIRDALEFRRLREDPASTRFYYGVMRIPPESKILGAGGSGAPGNLNRTAVGWDGSRPGGGSTFYGTLAHELGHCCGRDHTPAGDAPGADPGYPHPEGRLDAAGMDLGPQSWEPKVPGQSTDIMGYGPASGEWISAYTWRGIMDYLRRDPSAHPEPVDAPLLARGDEKAAPATETKETRSAAGKSQPARSLFIHGSIQGDRVRWEPMVEIPGRGPDPRLAGAYLLKCLDRSGNLLAAIPFDVFRKEGREAEPAFGFSLVAPMTAGLERHFAEVQIYRGQDRLDVHQTWGAQGHPLRPRTGTPGHPVEARRVGGKVVLRWDGKEHPRIFVRDPRDGAIIAQLDGGSGEVATDAAELEVIRSTGWSTDRVEVQVQ